MQGRDALRRPSQAVILAGGRGTRLGPLTATRPKPMIEIHGRPFLAYLIEMLRDQGFTDVLLLLGYLPEVIQAHFGDGRRFGIRIEYSVSAVDDLTVRRIQVARSRIDPCFLLMYCDNYWPMQIHRMWERFLAANVPAMVTVYSNTDGYSRDSVRLDDGGFVTVIDRSRTTAGLRGVEISYAIVTAPALELLPEHDALFEDAVYPELARRRQLAAYVTDHRYYSVGCLDRLPLTEAFLARRPAIILDRDGVLNKRPPRAEYVGNWEDFEWLPGAKEALRLLKETGYRVIVVSNQAGIGRGVMSEAELLRIHDRMRAEVINAGGFIDGFYYCPHDWDGGCECRKPKPGMLYQAQRDFSLDLTQTLFVGDDERDAEAGKAAGCATLLVSDGMSLLDIIRRVVKTGGASEGAASVVTR